MTPQLDQLVREIADLTGVARPSWLEGDSPVLSETASASAEVDGFYLIGLIGGKDVGKSALINAIVGSAITAQTSHGPGTETVIAYAHESQAAALKILLEAEVPGKYSIVTHRQPQLARQVLLDLPDIDSHYTNHLEVTRRMLRHMPFPVWVQSVEKYADRQPQQMLARVAAGNSPANFVFCLNKVDQVDGMTGHLPSAPPPVLRGRVREGALAVDGPPPQPSPGVPGEGEKAGSLAIRELQEDFAARLGRTLQLPAAPRVWAISAIKPDRYELPAVRALLAQQKSADDVKQSWQLAADQQRNSVLHWLADCDLPGRTARLQRLHDEAEEFIDQRLSETLLDNVIPALLDDPAHRQLIIDDCMQQRVARWPIVNVLHTLYSAMGKLVRRNTEARPLGLGARVSAQLVDQHLLGLADAPTTTGTVSTELSGAAVAGIIQSTFAALQQKHPTMGPLYQNRKLWESVPASTAAAELRQSLVGTIERQRAAIAHRAMGRDGPIAALLRGLFTIGAAAWFAILQPVVRALMQDPHAPGPTPHHDIGLLLVDLLSVENLLRMLTLLILYFTGIWLFLQWDTQRRVNRQFARWKRLDTVDPSLSLPAAAMEWVTTLLEPIRSRREQFDVIATRVAELRANKLLR